MSIQSKSAKTAKAAPAASMSSATPFSAANPFASAANPFEAFNFPTVEVPAQFREFAEKAIAGARDAYARMKSAAEDATDVVEDTYETARAGAFNLGIKTLDAAKSNTDASFAFARDLFAAKTFSEVIELQTAYARKQFDAVTAQVKEFQELSQKFVTEATKPVTAQVEKTFKDIRAA
jgi:phasin